MVIHSNLMIMRLMRRVVIKPLASGIKKPVTMKNNGTATRVRPNAQWLMQPMVWITTTRNAQMILSA